jgi:hypothetical protein
VAGGLLGGLAAVLLSYMIGSMHCERCGPIPKKEFPPEVRTEMRVSSLAIFSVTAMTLVGAVYFLLLQRH